MVKKYVLFPNTSKYQKALEKYKELNPDYKELKGDRLKDYVHEARLHEYEKYIDNGLSLEKVRKTFYIVLNGEKIGVISRKKDKEIVERAIDYHWMHTFKLENLKSFRKMIQ